MYHCWAKVSHLSLARSCQSLVASRSGPYRRVPRSRWPDMGSSVCFSQTVFLCTTAMHFFWVPCDVPYTICLLTFDTRNTLHSSLTKLQLTWIKFIQISDKSRSRHWARDYRRRPNRRVKRTCRRKWIWTLSARCSRRTWSPSSPRSPSRARRPRLPPPRPR